MKILKTMSLIAILAISGSSLNAKMLTDSDLNLYFDQYQTVKEKYSLKDILETLKTNKQLESDAVIPTLGSFYSRILNEENKHIFINEANKWNDKEKRMFVHAILFSDLKEKKEIIASVLKKDDLESSTYFNKLFNNEVSLNLLEVPVRLPAVVDMLWGSYFATENKIYLIRMTSVLEMENYETEVFKVSELIKWSLFANAQKHESIRTYLKEAKVSIKTRELFDLMLKRLEGN